MLGHRATASMASKLRSATKQMATARGTSAPQHLGSITILEPLLVTGSDTRKITMPRDRLTVFLHVTGNCKMAPRQDAQKPGNASLSRWTTRQYL